MSQQLLGNLMAEGQKCVAHMVNKGVVVVENPRHYLAFITPAKKWHVCALGHAMIGKHTGNFNEAVMLARRISVLPVGKRQSQIAEALGINAELAKFVEWAHEHGRSLEKLIKELSEGSMEIDYK